MADTTSDFLLVPIGARPAARALLRGDAAHTALRGVVNFYAHRGGTLMIAEVRGLPHDSSPCANNIFAMHIHAGRSCSGTPAFSDAGGHFNPGNCPHPAHAGDLPPLCGCRGYAWQAFYTDRFIVRDIIGRTIIIHSQRDDFTTQPAGDAGLRIGCGMIVRV